MARPQLEHIIRSAAQISGAQEFIIIGSQAVLGRFPDAPAELIVSIEADVFTLHNPADADLIDSSIREGSPFYSLSAATPTCSGGASGLSKLTQEVEGFGLSRTAERQRIEK